MINEEIRQERQAQLDRKIEKLRTRAARLEREADEKQAEFNSHRGDIAWLTQPANAGDAFGRSRIKALNRYDKGIQLRVEVMQLREKADFLEKRGAVVKGDAERAREEKRSAADEVIIAGSRVFSPLYRAGEVVKVNRKTYTIRFDSGFTTTQDKSWIKPL